VPPIGTVAGRPGIVSSGERFRSALLLKRETVPKQQLNQRIQELLDELEQVETADPGAREHLTSVLNDIRSMVSESEPKHADDGESLRERLNEATRHFEESHPTLTAMLGRVADSLSALGI
jgi:hypothetical protein